MSWPASRHRNGYGYVRGLKFTAEELGVSVVEYGLLDVCNNPRNFSGVVLMVKPEPVLKAASIVGHWQCPLTDVPMVDQGNVFYAEKVDIAYPVMRGEPLLRVKHGVVATKIKPSLAA